MDFLAFAILDSVPLPISHDICCRFRQPVSVYFFSNSSGPNECHQLATQDPVQTVASDGSQNPAPVVASTEPDV